MTPNKFPQLAPTMFIGALVAAACANPKRVDEGPITVMRNGDRVENPSRTLDVATMQALESRLAGRERRDSLTAVALANCTADGCAALGRGELSLGMTEAQVLAAARTTSIAWAARHSGGGSVPSPRHA